MSADAGKIRVGDTRFDVTGGMASIATLATRLAKQKTKSSTTGNITEIDSGKYGAPTTGSVLLDFASNKLSPAASVIKELRTQKDRQGNKSTVFGEARNLFEPLPITNYLELKNNPNSANTLVSILADALGISTNTYSPKPKK